MAPHGIPAFDVDLFSDELLADPYPTYRQLRDAAPVVWIEPLQMYCCARYEEARKVLSDHDTFISSRGVGFNDFLNQAFDGTIIQSDPPAHTALRRTLAQQMSPQAMRELQSGVETQADALIERLLALGTFDGVRDLARVFPLTVVAHLIGIPQDGRDRLLAWGDANFNVVGPENERHLQAKPVFAECFEYIQWIDQDPGRLRPGSLGAAIYEAAERGEIRRDQCPPLLAAYLVAGIDTTISSIASALSLFGRHSDQWALLREDASLVPRAYNEVLRIESPAVGFKRVLSRDFELSGARLPANASVAVLYASANRDERKFDQPDRFDVKRAAASQLAFGHGIHVCAGQALARLEAGALLNSMIKRVARIEVGLETRHLNNTVRSLETLEVTFQ
jgi:cytochrome P450